MTTIRFLSAVLVVTRQLEVMREFYAEVLGLELVQEDHGDGLPHYGCELGDIHFAIHPVENFDEESDSRGRIHLAFSIPDMADFVQSLSVSGYTPLYEPRNVGFAIMTALIDPDGNYLEFTQLSDIWYSHLERRRQQGHDILANWNKTTSE